MFVQKVPSVDDAIAVRVFAVAAFTAIEGHPHFIDLAIARSVVRARFSLIAGFVVSRRWQSDALGGPLHTNDLEPHSVARRTSEKQKENHGTAHRGDGV